MHPQIKKVKFQNQMDNSNFIKISKYNIPKHTAYLVIVLVLIGIILWYITNDKPNKNKKKNKNEDED
jgi:preprotein translocase subunit SecG